MSAGVASERIAIVGLGLIGGSLARALRSIGPDLRLIGCDRNTSALQRARELGVIDEAHREVGAAAHGADLVCLAVPLGDMAAVLEGLAAKLTDTTLITDVGSVKRTVVEEARALLGPHMARFVPGHPIAGTEESGIEASFAGLFNGQRVILTPVAETDPAAVEAVGALWRRVGARVELMEVARHDQVLAATSHLPHALAYTLVHLLAEGSGPDGSLRYAGGGFADLTRIASSSPTLWRDIFFANRERLIEAIGRFQRELAVLREAIDCRDGARLLAILERAKAARDALAAEREGRAHRPVAER